MILASLIVIHFRSSSSHTMSKHWAQRPKGRSFDPSTYRHDAIRKLEATVQLFLAANIVVAVIAIIAGHLNEPRTPQQGPAASCMPPISHQEMFVCPDIIPSPPHTTYLDAQIYVWCPRTTIGYQIEGIQKRHVKVNLARYTCFIPLLWVSRY
ncbi:hypothetical protein B0J11DRAFT_148123 [Dendryphion nanum]|uniref:Uncharacterized protein n=1 Tax=Dendryphion nanum TaxID=256645 RepID=A0A9P9IWK6_9PLEO|nr:hypothetical protein B0J11DRAFT_148123 [Dendryphion nanum]